MTETDRTAYEEVRSLFPDTTEEEFNVFIEWSSRKGASGAMAGKQLRETIAKLEAEA